MARRDLASLPPFRSRLDGRRLHAVDRSEVVQRAEVLLGSDLVPAGDDLPSVRCPGLPASSTSTSGRSTRSTVWAVIDLTRRGGTRPDWRSYATAVEAILARGLAVLGFNAVAGTNYGFLNAKAGHPFPARLMGDWPRYVGVELAGSALITWPSTRSRSEQYYTS